MPDNIPLPYANLMTISHVRLNVKPKDFWKLTFGEWWPLYNLIEGKTVKPMNRDEFESLEETWVNGNA